MPALAFRSCARADTDACLALFDANCPEFFAPNERADFAEFLEAGPAGYEVCESAGRIVGAFGLRDDAGDDIRLNWIMLDPDHHGTGIGSAIMERVISIGRASQSSAIRIAASHKSAPFFAKFGATVVLETADGWGPGMDRVDMELCL